MRFAGAAHGRLFCVPSVAARETRFRIESPAGESTPIPGPNGKYLHKPGLLTREGTVQRFSADEQLFVIKKNGRLGLKARQSLQK